MEIIKQIFSLLRWTHWSKSFFVLLGVIYSFAPQYLVQALEAAISFSFIASAVYIYNDLQDFQEDRLHPVKQQRPLASGELSFPFAFFLLIIVLLLGLVIGWFVSPMLLLLEGLYLLINLAYNHGLKQVALLDVLAIAAGFMLRVLAGTLGIGLPISWWLTSIATLISLCIALCKRRLEKQLKVVSRTREVLDAYSLILLDGMIGMTAFGSFLLYLLYVIEVRQGSFYFVITLPFAVLGLWRFTSLVRKKQEQDDPVLLFLNDDLSRFNALCFFIFTLLALIP